MGTPYHLPTSASRFFPKDKVSAEYRALSLIAGSLTHPDRTLLSVFIQQAADKEIAAQFFINEVHGEKEAMYGFLEDWISILHKVRPAICSHIDMPLRDLIWKRDDGRCCFSEDHLKKHYNEPPLHVSLPDLSYFLDDDANQNERVRKILAAYIGDSSLEELHALVDERTANGARSADQFLLLSAKYYEHFHHGRISLKTAFPASPNSAQYFVKINPFLPGNDFGPLRSITLKNKATELIPLPNTYLLGLHRQFADPLAWLEVSQYMRQIQHAQFRPKMPIMSGTIMQGNSSKSWGEWFNSSIRHAFTNLWGYTPVAFRAYVYRYLAKLGHKLYGHTGSDRTHRLPCSLYLRIARSNWVPRHRAEFESLRLVELYTNIPAPRPIDVIEYGNDSYLLMTRVAGRPVGHLLYQMTDEMVDGVAQDLRQYVAELRRIPNNWSSKFQICNALGEGILDWRIGNSQRESLRFKDETAFHDYLTHQFLLSDDQMEQISKAYSVKRQIVFTHADLNMRNILVGDDGRLSGVVDWECSGWYPEYWEYTKMHFGVRFSARWIVDVIDQIFDDYEDELRAEDILSSIVPSW